MLKFISGMGLAAGLLLLVSCGSAESTRTGPMAGAYGPGKQNDAVQEAAIFAVKTEAKKEGRPLELVKILKVEQQVVAGMNYRLLLAVKKNGKAASAGAVVYRDLQGGLQLTSWAWR